VSWWTYFSALQVLVAIAALTWIVRRLQVLLFEAPLDASAFVPALATALEAGQIALASNLAAACEPAWPARLARLALVEIERGRNPRNALDETYADLESALWQGRDAIVVLGRMATPVAFIGVIVQTGLALGGGEGLAGLQRGLPASIALQRSLLAFSIGLSTTIVCLTAAATIQRHARALRRDLDRVSRVIAEPRGAPRNEM
jgi:hypothetical protein